MAPGSRVSRGQIVIVSLDQGIGSELRGGRRPCIVVQNDVGNEHSPLTIVATLYRPSEVKPLRTHVRILKPEGGLENDSVADCGHLLSISKERIVKHLQKVSPDTMRQVDQALKIALQLP